MDPTALPVTTGFNFRELGGYVTTRGKTIRTHRLLRTGAWNALSEADLAYLKAYGVRTVVDFRSVDESTPRPDRLPVGVQRLALPTFTTMPGAKTTGAANTVKDAANEPAAQVIEAFRDAPADLGLHRMENVYEGLATSDSAAKAYREFFQAVVVTSEAGAAIAFHCSAGKDRTGVAAYLHLTALGVDHDQIQQDYLQSASFNHAHVAARWAELKAAGAPDNVLAIVRDRMTVRGEYLLAYEAALTNRWGGVHAYLHDELGVTTAMCVRLQAALLQ